MNDPNAKVSMIGTDGGVKYIPFYLREEMLKKGWLDINNPKHDYYPEFDQNLQGFAMNRQIDEKESNLLEVKVL